MSHSPIRVRIAPSPTGNLHIGTARTALFNYLFARHHQGTMVLRIEDTDLVRSQEHFTQDILNGLQGLGISWDEGPGIGGDYGPYYQTQRSNLYRQAIESLIAKGAVYPCFCTEEELAAERQAAQDAGKTYVYSGKWRNANAEEVQKRIEAGDAHVWRLKVPSKEVVIDDLIRGEIRIHSDVIGDFIIAKGDKAALYNFAVVVDDVEMKITHVLRGEDHISNTPKQILIYEALEATLPRFGHMAMILAPDRSKLSKRHGATSVAEYLKQGFLAPALVNYLALLGWAPPEGREKLTLEEMGSLFDLDKVNKSGAIFDIEKLRWLNSVWIREEYTPESLLPLVQQQLILAGYNAQSFDPDWLKQSIAMVQEKLVVLSDFISQTDFLLKPELVYQPEQVGKAFAMESAKPVLEAFGQALKALSDWNEDSIHSLLDQLKQSLPYKMKEIMWPIRAALTGRTSGPDLHKLIKLLGQTQACSRVEQAISCM